MNRAQLIWWMTTGTSSWSGDHQTLRSPDSECWLRVQRLSYIDHESVKLVKHFKKLPDSTDLPKLHLLTPAPGASQFTRRHATDTLHNSSLKTQLYSRHPKAMPSPCCLAWMKDRFSVSSHHRAHHHCTNHSVSGRTVSV